MEYTRHDQCPPNFITLHIWIEIFGLEFSAWDLGLEPLAWDLGLGEPGWEGWGNRLAGPGGTLWDLHSLSWFAMIE